MTEGDLQREDTRTRARRLRALETDAERKLWSLLRNRQIRGVKFRRQHPLGPFIADFCCPERHLVIEVDGGQHASQVEADRRGSTFLAGLGYRVLRYWDHEVLQETEAVLEHIYQAVGDPHADPLPRLGGEGRVRGTVPASSAGSVNHVVCSEQ